MDNRNSALPPLDYLLAMDAAADCGSFKGASKILNISESAVSRKVKLLELHYDQTFFKRGERSIALTHQGQKFHENIAPILNDLRALSRNMLSNTSQNIVTLSATHSVAGLWLMPRLGDFNAKFNDVTIKLVSSDNDEECLGADMDLTILRGNGKWTGYDAKLLFGETVFPVCSPGYLDNNPEIRDIERLTDYSLIGVDSQHTEWMTWTTWLSAKTQKDHWVDQAVLLNTYPLSIDAAQSGLGVALGWGHLVDHLIDAGKLVRPLVDAAVRTEFGYYLLKPAQRSSFEERDKVEAWLISVSEGRKRYGNVVD